MKQLFLLTALAGIGVGLVAAGCTTTKKAERIARGVLAAELDRQNDKLKQKYVTEPCETADQKWDELIGSLKKEILKED